MTAYVLYFFFSLSLSADLFKSARGERATTTFSNVPLSTVYILQSLK